MNPRCTACFWLCCVLSLSAFAAPTSLRAQTPRAPALPTLSITAASLLGDAGSSDAVRGARIQPDGAIVLAVNLGAGAALGVTSTTLGAATPISNGAVLRLSADGRAVQSITRIASLVNDLSIDAAGNIYVAAWQDGLFKLNPDASAILWRKPDARVLRVDATANGVVAALSTTTNDLLGSAPGAGTLSMHSADGTALGAIAGRHNTLDVCVDGASESVISLGWRQATAEGNPVQIAYIRAVDYAGAPKYIAYDWSTTVGDPRYLNAPTNNMADTRGYRCVIGADGKLYAAFESAGGNHIFRYSPFEIGTRVTLAGGDLWQQFSNTRSEHKTVFARYEPSTGAFLAGQEYTARLGATQGFRGNTLRVSDGAIMADAQGRVYIGGSSAWGLPLPPHERHVDAPERQVFNPLATDPSAYLGGAWLTVFSPDFKTRLYTTRLTEGGSTSAIDARAMADGGVTIAFGGIASATAITKTHTLNAVQPNAGGGAEGWFAVLSGAPAVTATPAPTRTPDPRLTRDVFLPVTVR
jgi:hypothetical protein